MDKQLIAAGRIITHTGNTSLASPVAQFMQLANRRDDDEIEFEDDPDERNEARMNVIRDNKQLHD